MRKYSCLVIASLALNAARGEAAELFWTEFTADASGSIQKSALTGGTATPVVPGGLRGAFRMAVDTGEQKMYWSSTSGDGIRRANLDGSGVETLIAESDPILGLAFDPIGQRVLYYRDQDVWAARTDGSDVRLVFEDFGAVENLAVDAQAGKLYLGQRGVAGNGVIWRANLDGTGLEQVITGIVNGPIGMAVDPAGGAIYWAQAGAGERGIRRAGLDGAGVQTLVDDVDVDALVLDAGSGRLVWTATDGASSWIEASDMSGGDRDVIQPGVNAGGLVVVPEPAAGFLLAAVAAWLGRSRRAGREGA